jgi:alpha-glucosidase
MKIRIILWPILLFASLSCSDQKKIIVTSPDGNLKFTLISEFDKGNEGWSAFTLEAGNKKILLPSFIQLNTEIHFKENDFDVLKIENESVNNKWQNNFGERKEVPDNYNQVKIYMANNDLKFNMICRAYNEGIAFAWEFPGQNGMDSLTIKDEKITFSFLSDHFAWSAARAQAQYSKVPLSLIEKGCERPLVIEIDTNLIIALAEAKLVDYARMKFNPDTTRNYNVITQLGSPVHELIPFQSPWRVIMIGKNPRDLLEKNYLLLNLNDPCKITDVSWIKPGKVLREVTLTTAGAKAAVDFTSSHNMQYVEFDAGWYGPENNDISDARAVNLDPARSKGPLDMEEVISYTKSKNINILLYVNRRALEKQLDELLPIYKKWDLMPPSLQKQSVFSVRCSFFTGMTKLLQHLKKMMACGEQQTISAMNRNWNSSIMCQLSGMKQKFCMQKSGSMESWQGKRVMNGSSAGLTEISPGSLILTSLSLIRIRNIQQKSILMIRQLIPGLM